MSFLQIGGFMSPFTIVHSLIKFALYVGIAGGLVDMTIAMGRKAGEARKVGLVSLSELNRSLYPKK